MSECDGDDGDDDDLEEFGLDGEDHAAPRSDVGPFVSSIQSPPPAEGMTKILIGTRLQPLARDERALGNGIRWDVDNSVHEIDLSVSFVHSATFSGSLFGKEII